MSSIDWQNEDVTEHLINFGALGYSSLEMSVILNVDESEIIALMKNKNSEFRKLYEKGIIYAKYLIDKKLFDLAKNGDIKAIKEIELREAKKRMTNG